MTDAPNTEPTQSAAPGTPKEKRGLGRYAFALIPLLVFAGIAGTAGKMLYDQDVHGKNISEIPSALLGTKAPSLDLPPLEGANLPALTEERRRELAKVVAHEGENAKVAVRNVRRDALHHIKELLKERKITEDENSRAEDDIQKLTDKFVKDVDGVVKLKEDELMAM